MACSNGLQLDARRNADFKTTFTFPAGYNLSGVEPRMQVKRYEGDTGPALVAVTTTPNGYGSVLNVTGNSIVLIIDDGELSTITPEAAPTDPNVLAYDIILLMPDGFEQYFVGGPFVLYPGVTT